MDVRSLAKRVACVVAGSAPAAQELEIFSEKEEEKVAWAGLGFKLSQPSQKELGSGDGCSEPNEVDQLLSVVGAC